VKHFPDEYIMLTALACDDKDTFDGLSDDPTLTNHLIGYGLIERGVNGFYFKIESVRDHLRKQQRFSVTLKSNSERLLEVTTRRILLEPALRRLVATILQSRFGGSAKETAEKYLTNQSLKRLKENGFKAAFDAHSKDTNLSELAKIISGEWELFKNMFTLQKVEFDFYIETIRKARTEEAHTGKISQEEFKIIRIAFSKIEVDLQLSGFLVTPT
jgi:hypothetical protein